MHVDDRRSTTNPASQALFERAEQVLPGGVNSPVRAFRAVGGTPRFIARAQGSRVWDVDGNELIDYVGSWGPMILGHAPPAVIAAIERQLASGLAFGAPTALEVDMAEAIARLVPSIEMVRLVSSGTEATMAAVRLARAVDRPRADHQVRGLLSRARRQLSREGRLRCRDVRHARQPGRHAGDGARHADGALQRRRRGPRAASRRIPARSPPSSSSPSSATWASSPPRGGSCRTCATCAPRDGALLIFDEVMTGFRVARGGAQERYGVTPDLTTLGKIIGGGLPVGAYGGRRDLMSTGLALRARSTRPARCRDIRVAMAAGLATLERSSSRTPASTIGLEALGAALECGVIEPSARPPTRCQLARVGSMWTLFFTAIAGDRLDERGPRRPRALRPVLPRDARRAASRWRRRSSRPTSSRRRTRRSDIAATVAGRRARARGEPCLTSHGTVAPRTCRTCRPTPLPSRVPSASASSARRSGSCGRPAATCRSTARSVSDHDFLTSCRTPELACEITLQPVRRLGVDAAILFSDILVPLPGMGVDVTFNPGPHLAQPVRIGRRRPRLRVPDPRRVDRLRARRGAADSRASSPAHVPLIGFAGAPFTVATYLVEGGGSKSFSAIKRLLFASRRWRTAARHLHRARWRVSRGAGRGRRRRRDAVRHVGRAARPGGLRDVRPARTSGASSTRRRPRRRATGRDVPRIYYAGDAAGWLDRCRDSAPTVIGLDWRMDLDRARAVLGRRLRSRATSIRPCCWDRRT